MAIFDSVGTTQRSSKLLSQFLYYKDEWSCKVYKHLPKACSSYVEDEARMCPTRAGRFVTKFWCKMSLQSLANLVSG